MESKQQFLEMISKSKKERQIYFHELFKNAPDEVIRAMQYEKAEKRQTIVQAGKPCDNVYIILNGSVSGLDYQSSGEVFVFMDAYHMDVVGDFEVFGGVEEYSSSIQATTECEMLVIPSVIYLRWMKSDVNALFMRTQSIMKILANENSEKRRYLLLNCKERLILYLVYIYENRGRGKSLRLKNTQSELAERVGFNVRTIQRNILLLENEGYITHEGGKISISQEQYLLLKQYVAENLETK